MAHWRETPSHGYLVLTSLELDQLPPAAKTWHRHDPYTRAGNEFEEDIAWTVPAALLDVLYTPGHDAWLKGMRDPAEVRADARLAMRGQYPDLYELLTGETVTPEQSGTRRRQIFDRENADRWVVIAASGDWKAGCPKGYVECIATLGKVYPGYEDGRRIDPEYRTYYVPDADYDARNEFGYVIPEGMQPGLPAQPEQAPDPEPFPIMVEGPGAPQYTFSPPPDAQLSLL